MIFRRIVGLLLLLLTVVTYIATGTMNDVQLEFWSPWPDVYLFTGLWLAWALIVLFMVRRDLPLGTGRFVLRMLGIDR